MTRPRGRAERMLLAAFATVFLVLPVLHREHRRVDRERQAEAMRRLLDSEAEGRLDRAVAAATDPVRGAHFFVAQSLAEEKPPTDLAFRLWSAAGWDPREPCAVEIYDIGLLPVSSFDLDAPPSDLLPAPPTALESARGTRAGRGAGESIRFRVRDVPLHVGEAPVGLARFIMPVRWDLIRSNLRRPIFAEPESALVRAEFGMDGHPLYVSTGSPDELPAIPDRVRERAREHGYATRPIKFRDQPARMLVVPGGVGFGAVITERSLWSQVLFEAAHLLAIVALGCLIYTALRWRQMEWAFRHSIALVLVLVSMVPVIVIGLNQRGAIRKRYEAQVAAELRAGLDLAENVLKGRAVNNETCIELSTAHRIDVNVYEGSKLLATSRPGVWDTGLLSRRLAAPAYEELLLKKQRQYIGREPFAGTGDLRAGYRRIGESRILATPRLSDREEPERSIARENARLGALYVLAAALAVLVSLPISYMLIRPVRRLEGATREVAAGNLDVEVPRARGRGELSQLMRSFEQMTRDLRDAQDIAARAERAAAWREMAQQIAHDVKNPLTPIKLTIQNLLALQKEAPDLFEEEFERGSGLILEQIDQLQRIAGNFSSFARMPDRQADPVDVASLLRETADLHGAAGAIDVDTDGAELVVRADRDELSRMLHNLLSNAREADAEKIQLRGAREDGHVRIDVIDDGRGIDAEAMDRIFEPSFTTRTRGTGLGLPIVKRIVDDLDGTIAIDSQAGSGTRITILLPAATA
ncbi:MAG: sensor histidine kinase [Planctomycetota bacterium]